MKNLFVYSFCFLFVVTFGDECPQGAVHYDDRAECIDAIDAKATYAKAQLFCAQLNGILVQPRDIFENVIVGTQAGQAIASNSQSYIGVQKRSNGVWTYGDGSPLTYQNWKSGHPQANASCAVLSAQNYLWTSVDCTSGHTFVCSIPDQKPTLNTTMAVFTTVTPNATMPAVTTSRPAAGCPNGWTQYRVTGKCYYFWGYSNATNDTYYHADGERICQQMGAHLVSIHSQAEFNFLKDIIATNSTDTDCHTDQAFIGLTCVTVNREKQYTWSDGSQFEFDKSHGYCADVYGIINDPNCYETGYWDPWFDSMSFAHFICEKRPN